MLHYIKIEKQILTGIHNTCLDVLNISRKFDGNTMPECLLTLNIAKAIGKLNYNYGVPYLVDYYKQDNPGWMGVSTNQLKSKHLFTYIKTRLVNPSKNRLESDLLKLSQMLKKSEQLGMPHIKNVYFASILYDENITTLVDAKKTLEKEHEKYAKWIKSILKHEKTIYKLEVIPIHGPILLALDQKNNQNASFFDIPYQTTYFAGLIVKLSKNK
ncbi:MAG: hypothetical protein PHI52_08700 [Bacteroidales bacterium]|nr:hypothetical protein [Bacteroidales bacterium]